MKRLRHIQHCLPTSWWLGPKAKCIVKQHLVLLNGEWIRQAEWNALEAKKQERLKGHRPVMVHPRPSLHILMSSFLIVNLVELPKMWWGLGDAGGLGVLGMSWFPIFVFLNFVGQSTLVKIIGPPQSPAVVLLPDAFPQIRPNTKHLANGTAKYDITTWHAEQKEYTKSNEVKMAKAKAYV